MTGDGASNVVVAGSTVVVRDAEWIVEQVTPADGGLRLACRGLDELVRDSTATFLTTLDEVEVVDPAAARMVLDTSPAYRRTRLWVEAVLRKTPVPLHEEALSVAHRMLLDPLRYQSHVVTRALSLDNLRPRLLIADAVGLGKTLEIGLLLAELARRGRAERVLVVTPRHVLEQMQRELWTRFSLPLVRLDSEGIARIRQELPATRNPFTYFPRVIVSVDTLKSDRYRAHLEKQRWEVVVIDESHNVTNSGTLNHQLASVLAPRTEALLLASATPHNEDPRSFASLVDLLDPTAIIDRDSYDVGSIDRLFVRRHRHSPDVAAEVGHDWAERAEPEVLTVVCRRRGGGRRRVVVDVAAPGRRDVTGHGAGGAAVRLDARQGVPLLVPRTRREHRQPPGSPDGRRQRRGGGPRPVGDPGGGRRRQGSGKARPPRWPAARDRGGARQRYAGGRVQRARGHVAVAGGRAARAAPPF